MVGDHLAKQQLYASYVLRVNPHMTPEKKRKLQNIELLTNKSSMTEKSKIVLE